MNKSYKFDLLITTQGPTYPPSEIMDAEQNFIVIGLLNLEKEGKCYQEWGAAVVSLHTIVPEFGKNLPYKFIKHLDIHDLQEYADTVLYTLPIPIPCNNYMMNFAPEQNPTFKKVRDSYPLHLAPIPDIKDDDGRKINYPIRLKDWLTARGALKVEIPENKQSANFTFTFYGLIPNSLYTVMALRENDLNPYNPTRPGPLGVPNVFITNGFGYATYTANMPNPFPITAIKNRNRIINVIVLWMSSQMSYGGAIGHYGLGGDIHAQLKLKPGSFDNLETVI